MRTFPEHLAPQKRERWNWACSVLKFTTPCLKFTTHISPPLESSGWKCYSNGGPSTWKHEARGRREDFYITLSHHLLNTYLLHAAMQNALVPQLELDRIRIRLGRFLTECVKGHGNLYPWMSGLKETLRLTESGFPSMLENTYSIFFLCPNVRSLCLSMSLKRNSSSLTAQT